MNVMKLAVASIAIAAGIGGLAAPAVAASSNHTLVISSCTTAKFEPHQYVLACADANILIRHAHYSSWSKGNAIGRGTYVYNTCLPSCAAGTFKHHPVTFTLGRVRKVSGQKLFTRMYVSYAGLTETFQLPATGS